MNKDNINPQHYQQIKEQFGVECIDVIEALGLNFHLGQVLKYIWRANDKNGVEDIEKALWYLQRYVDMLHGYDKALAEEVKEVLAEEPGVPAEVLIQGTFLHDLDTEAERRELVRELNEMTLAHAPATQLRLWLKRVENWNDRVRGRTQYISTQPENIYNDGHEEWLRKVGGESKMEVEDGNSPDNSN